MDVYPCSCAVAIIPMGPLQVSAERVLCEMSFDGLEM
jgi:hypothetical protein